MLSLSKHEDFGPRPRASVMERLGRRTRRAAVLILAVLLASCGGQDARAPFTDSRVPPGVDQAGWPPESWTWALIQIGRNPAQRYGVGAPQVRSRGHVLILPDYGEPAEAEFPAIAELMARGYVVWTLDGVGQGGSGRIASRRDLGYVKSFDADVEAVRALSAQAIRPRGAPLVIIARGAAAPVALRAVQKGLPGLTGLVLAAPRLTTRADGETALSRLERRLGLGGLRAPGGLGWRRVEPAADAPPLIRASYQWQLANPDLRMGAPSLAWFAAFGDLIRAMNAAGWKAVTVPVLILSGPRDASGDETRVCRALARCARAGEAPGAAARFVETLAGAQPTGAF